LVVRLRETVTIALSQEKATDSTDAALRAFAKSDSGPQATFPLVLVATTVAATAMHLDAVPKYSADAFFVGLGLAIGLAFVIGKLLGTVHTASSRAVIALFLPTGFGALIGMVVQALVLKDVGSTWATAVKDLGGLVDTTEPISWIASGIVLGGLPALLVSLFLLIAARALRKLTGHDASEGFSVAFTGAAGLIAAFGLVLADGLALPPVLVAGIAAGITLVVVLLVDGSRIRFLRRVYAGNDGAFDIVPAQRFAPDSSLAPIVADAGNASVLVRVDTRLDSYRGAAAAPVALLGDTEKATLRPLVRRRFAALAMLVAMMFLSGIAMLTHS
jgi:hypothetical protein